MLIDSAMIAPSQIRSVEDNFSLYSSNGSASADPSRIANNEVINASKIYSRCRLRLMSAILAPSACRTVASYI